MNSETLLEYSTANLARTSDHHLKLTNLRRLMAGTERRMARAGQNSDRKAALFNLEAPWSFGLTDIDAALPEDGLARDGVHEFLGATHADTVAASGCLLALLRQFSNASQSSDCGSILWCQTTYTQQEFGSVHGPGLKAFGFRSEQFLFARATRNRDILWALEEGARQSGLLAIVGEVETLSFTQARRLTLAAAAGGTPLFLLRPHYDSRTSAANTCWRIGAAPGGNDPFIPHAPGCPRWRVELARCRGGRPGSWTVEWNHETHCFRLAEQFPSRLPKATETPPALPKRFAA